MRERVKEKRRKRKLGIGSAGPGNVGNDFSYVGMTFWADVAQRYPVKGPKWNCTLESLNDVCDAVAHSDAVKQAEVRARQPLTLRTSQTWRRSLNDGASGFAAVVAAYLADVTGKVQAGGIDQDLHKYRCCPKNLELAEKPQALRPDDST